LNGVDGGGLKVLNSSPEKEVTVRTCLVPLSDENELASTLRVYVPSAPFTVYVPKCERTPSATALYSSGVPFSRSLEADGGMPARRICREERPLGVKISEPTGFEPKGSILLPSWRSTTTEVYAQVPTSWALEIFVWAIEVPESSPVKRHSSAAVATVSKRDRFI